ncbi:MAG TPA: HD domain-containing protein, partial [Candidatus Ozemobacteraceae bacterium]|nr:HD domain-containing protein [Candidatus Ozemobacteraceae bacterium]
MPHNDNQELVTRVTSAVRSALSDAEGGHDWWHTHRVWQMACRLAQAERAELLIVELGALLHDVADAKFHDGDETAGPRKTEAILTNCGATKPVIDTVRNLVAHVSFKGGNHVQEFRSLELDVVQDADRLDALGAIGIARAFSYGGYRGTPLHDPEIKPRLRMTREEYRS